MGAHQHPGYTVGVLGVKPYQYSKQRASVRLGPVWCGHRNEGPDDGVEWVRQEVRSEREVPRDLGATV